MHGKIELLSPRKASSDSTALPSLGFIPPCMQGFRVSIPPDVRPTLLRQMDMGSLTYTQIWVRAVHTKGGVRHKQVCILEWTLGGQEISLSLRLPHQGIEPRVFGFEFRCTNH